MNQAKIAVVGSLNMDLVARAPHMPQAGETILGGDLHTLPGGKGANQAVAAARLGSQVSMIGRVGEDTFAQPLLENLAQAGVNHTFVTEDPAAATGVALIIVDDAGQNMIVVTSGANMRLSPADVEAAEEVIANAKVLLLQLESPLETVIRAAELARKHHVTVILNPAPAQPLPSSLLSLVDILVPNESETSLLTSLPVENDVQAQHAAQVLRQKGVQTVILTLGERGALLVDEQRTERVPAYPVTPVDTTAAGDAFIGGFATALAAGCPMQEAIRWGNAAGGLATTKLGAQPSLPTREEVEAMVGER